MKVNEKFVQVPRVRSEAMTQITLDEDYNVPDYRPDIGHMIQKTGDIRMNEVQVKEGRAEINGILQFRLLYVADTPGREVCSLEGKVPVAETLHLDGLESGDKVCLKWEIEDLSLYLINSRKLNVKAVIGFRAYVDDVAKVALPVGVEMQPELSEKKREMSLLTLAVHKKDTLREKMELSLPSNKPNIREILWNDIKVRGLELRANEGKVAVKGEICVFVLYEGDDEGNPLQWMEKALPFAGEVSCEDCTFDRIPSIQTSLLQANLEIKPDADGEERILLADVVLELDIRLYREDTVSVLLDVYTPKKECLIQRKKEILQQLLVKNDSKCQVSDRITLQEAQGKILQICHSDGTVQVDEIQIVENGIQVKGILQVRILYSISDDEMPFYSMETALPFTHKIEAPGIDAHCMHNLQANLELLTTSMLDGSDIEVKAVLSLGVLVLRQWEEELISGIQEEDPDPEKLEQMPGIVCYLVQPQDTLWDIAKRFYTTVDMIRELNGLGDEDVKPQQSLMIVKQADG